MSIDLATLGLEVRSDGVVVATERLRELARQSGRTENNVNGINRATDSLTSQMKKLAVAIAGVIAIQKVFDFSKEVIDLASDLEETQGKFDVVFRGMTSRAEEWSKSLRDSYAMSEIESKKYLSSIQDLVVPTGMARDAAGELSNKFVKMAADLGSFNNFATSDVIMDIQSALQGSSETMAKYGINVKAAKVEQEILNQKWVASKKDITDAHKAQAIYNIIMRDGADAAGDIFRTSKSYANQLKKLNSNINDFKTNIGKELLPTATKLVISFNNWYAANEDILSQNIPLYAKNTAIALSYLIDGATALQRIFIFAGKSIATNMTLIEMGVWKMADSIVNGPIEKLNLLVKTYNFVLSGINDKIRIINENPLNPFPEIPELEKLNEIELPDLGKKIKNNIKNAENALKIGVMELLDYATNEMAKPLPGSGIRAELEKIEEQAEKTKKAIEKGGLPKIAELGVSPIKSHDIELETPTFIEDKTFDIIKKKYEDLKEELENPISFNFAESTLSDIANMMNGIDNLTGSWQDYGKTLEKINFLREKGADVTKLEKMAGEKMIKTQLSGYSNLFGAMSQYYDEGSKGRKRMHQLEMAFGALEIALELKKMIPLAANAILTQGSGDPYSAFGRIAAMTAIAGGVIAAAGGSSSFSGGGGGGGGGATSGPKISPTTGTVLGAPDESSKSLSESFEMLESFNDLQYGELQKIYQELKDLNTNITGLVGSIIRDVGMMGESDFNLKFGEMSQGKELQKDIADYINPDRMIQGAFDKVFSKKWMRDLSGLGSSYFAEISDWAGEQVGKITGWVVDGIKGKKTTKLLEAGYMIGEIAFLDIESGAIAAVDQFGKVKTTTKSWFKEKSSTDIVTEDASQEIIDRFNAFYQGVVGNVTSMASTLDIDIDMSDFTFGEQLIDILNMSGEEINEELNAWASTLTDKVFTEAFYDKIGRFVAEGETLPQTATRLAIGLELIKSAVEKTGVVFSATGEQALLVSDSLAPSFEALEEFSEIIEGYYDSFTSKGDKLRDTKRMVDDNLSGIIEAYKNAFDINDGIEMAIPKTKEDFDQLVSRFFDLADVDTSSNQLYMSLMKLAPAFSEVEEAEDEFRKKLLNMDDWFSSFGPELDTITKKFKNVEKELKSFRQEMDDLGQSVPEGWEPGGAVETAIKNWIVAMEEYTLSSSISSDIFNAIANEQTKLDYAHWQRLQSINALSEATGKQYPDMIKSANELYDLRKKQLDEERNTVWELKEFYEELSTRVSNLRNSVESQLKSFQTREKVSADFGRLTQEYNQLDPTSQDYLEQSTMLLEQIWESGNELYDMEDKAMQDMVAVQKEQLQAQLDTLEAQKESLEKQIGTLQQIEGFLFDLSGGSLAPVQSAKGMMKQYDKLLGEATKTGDISSLESFIKGGFFEFFKAYGNYKDVNKMVISDITDLGDVISGGATLDDLNVQLDTLNNTIESIKNKMENIQATESVINGMDLEAWTKSMLPMITKSEEQIGAVISGLDIDIANLNENALSLIQAIDTWGEELSAQSIMEDSKLLIDSQSILKESIDNLNNTIITAFMDQLPADQIVTTAFQNLFGRTPSEDGLNFWTEQLESGAIAISNFKDSMVAAASGADLEYYNTMYPGFSRGGTFIAGERGPELVSINHGSQAKITSNGETMRMMVEAVGQAITGAGVTADVRVFIGEKEIKDVMIKVVRKDNEYQKEIKRAVKVA